MTPCNLPSDNFITNSIHMVTLFLRHNFDHRKHSCVCLYAHACTHVSEKDEAACMLVYEKLSVIKIARKLFLFFKVIEIN